MFLKEMFMLWKNGSQQAESAILIVSSWTATTPQVPLITFPSRSFQADPYNCRVILEKKESLILRACRVRCPEAM